MKTAAEARDCWCPFGPTHHVPPLGDHREHGGREVDDLKSRAMCIASACMAWRWSRKQMIGEFDPKHGGLSGNREGYCGLAGEP